MKRGLIDNKPARIVLAALFVALLATPLMIKRIAARRAAATAVRDATSALNRYGFYLEEVAESSKVRFTPLTF